MAILTEPFSLTIATMSVSSPRFAQLSGTAAGLAIDSNGFFVASATLAYAGEVGIGSVLRVSGMSITASGFGYTVGSGASFNGSLTVAVGSASVFPDGPVSAEATGITVTVDLSPGHEGELAFTAATFAFTLAGVLEIDAANVSIDTDPAPGGLVVGFGQLSATFPTFGITGTIGDLAASPAGVVFGFNASGQIVVLPDVEFGFSLSTAGGDAGTKMGWPSWLPIQVDELAVVWYNGITEHPEDLRITISASLTAIQGLPVTITGGVQDAVIDVGKLLDGEFPIVSIGSFSAGVSGEMFGGEITAALTGGILRMDSEGFLLDGDGNRVEDGQPAVGAVTSALWAGFWGGFDIRRSDRFRAARGPERVRAPVRLRRRGDSHGILLEPNSGLTLNYLRGGVEFNATLPDLPDPADPTTGTVDEALQLRRDEFDSPAAMDVATWQNGLAAAVKDQLAGVIEARRAGLPDPNFWNVFAYPMIIRAGATLCSAYAPGEVFRAEVDLALDTEGRILINGNAVFADNLTLGVRFYADLSSVLAGDLPVPERLPRGWAHRPGVQPLRGPGAGL